MVGGCGVCFGVADVSGVVHGRQQYDMDEHGGAGDLHAQFPTEPRDGDGDAEGVHRAEHGHLHAAVHGALHERGVGVSAAAHVPARHRLLDGHRVPDGGAAVHDAGGGRGGAEGVHHHQLDFALARSVPPRLHAARVFLSLLHLPVQALRGRAPALPHRTPRRAPQAHAPRLQRQQRGSHLFVPLGVTRLHHHQATSAERRR